MSLEKEKKKKLGSVVFANTFGLFRFYCTLQVNNNTKSLRYRIGKFILHHYHKGAKLDEYECEEFKTNFKEVMLFIKYSKNKEKLEKVITSDSKFKCLERNAAEVINCVTNVNIEYEDEQEVVDVCIAVQEMIDESRREGLSEGRREGLRIGKIEVSILLLRELNFTIKDATEKIMDIFSMTREDALKNVNDYWDKI